MGFRQKSTGGRTLRKYKNLHEKKGKFFEICLGTVLL